MLPDILEKTYKLQGKRGRLEESQLIAHWIIGELHRSAFIFFWREDPILDGRASRLSGRRRASP
jgi:hypothetical protein